jgi:predicted nucleic-acid-binding Zn-ribbon protein
MSNAMDIHSTLQMLSVTSNKLEEFCIALPYPHLFPNMQRTLKSSKSEGSIMSTIKSSMTESSKCPSCTKAVYHVEEVICSGSAWHKDCFKCGGAGELGCQRKLNLSDFTLHTAVPYCKGCYMKVISKPVVAIEEIIVGASSGSDRTDINDLNGFVKISERRSSFGASGKATVVANALAVVRLACPKCSKTVFKAEEIVLAGFSWHKACFTCGGASEVDGCKKTLNQTDFHPHRKNPFCKGCIGKQPIMDVKKPDSSITHSEKELSETPPETADINGLPIIIDVPAASAASMVVATSVPAAAVPSPAVATAISLDEDNVETEDGVDVETSYQDENGFPCTKEGELLTSYGSTTTLVSDLSSSGM